MAFELFKTKASEYYSNTSRKWVDDGENVIQKHPRIFNTSMDFLWAMSDITVEA